MADGTRGGNRGLYFIVGALVVAVGVIFAVLSGSFHFGGGGGTAPAAASGSSTPSQVNVKVESKTPAAPAPSAGR